MKVRNYWNVRQPGGQREEKVGLGRLGRERDDVAATLQIAGLLEEFAASAAAAWLAIAAAVAFCDKS